MSGDDDFWQNEAKKIKHFNTAFCNRGFGGDRTPASVKATAMFRVTRHAVNGDHQVTEIIEDKELLQPLPPPRAD
jgi:hypothetical protein